MRRVAGTLIAILLVTTAAFAQGTMPQPEYAPGDNWSYEVHGRGVSGRATLTIIDASTYTMRVSTSQGTKAETGSLSDLLGRSSWPWPLEVGKTRTDSTTDNGVTVVATTTVDAYELLTVPAGTFKAFRLVMHTCGIEGAKALCGDVRVWWSSQVKNFVKAAFSNDRVWDRFQGMSFLLTSYSVSP